MVDRYRAGIPLVLLCCWAVLVWLAPAERTLGGGIRSVYVHVGLVWARINWGAVALNEPRMAASLRFLALALIAQVIAAWDARPRTIAAFAVATAVLLAWDVGGARLVMHPHDPIRTATSSAIQWTFASSFALAAALVTWTVIALRAHTRPR